MGRCWTRGWLKTSNESLKKPDEDQFASYFEVCLGMVSNYSGQRHMGISIVNCTRCWGRTASHYCLQNSLLPTVPGATHQQPIFDLDYHEDSWWIVSMSRFFPWGYCRCLNHLGDVWAPGAPAKVVDGLPLQPHSWPRALQVAEVPKLLGARGIAEKF